jgi:hypothetical protein
MHTKTLSPISQGRLRINHSLHGFSSGALGLATRLLAQAESIFKVIELTSVFFIIHKHVLPDTTGGFTKPHVIMLNQFALKLHSTEQVGTRYISVVQQADIW